MREDAGHLISPSTGTVAITVAGTTPAAQPLTSPGVRLLSVEVFNWGTFHGQTWRLDLNGGNGLLTGEIGAGKSTLVDAITTLFAPAHRISYNKAGQAERDERDLRSYVLGTYKSERSATGGARPVSLRTPEKTYSVILGRFRESASGETTTLAQVFWFKEPHGQPARFYVVAQGALSVREHFAGFGRDINALRQKLRKGQNLEIYDSYPPYGADFRRRFGISGEQAINLFLQTVSMKTVGDLTGFVRSHMLEPFPVETRIKQMILHFDDLSRAHEEVVKARRQIEQLGPLVADCDRHDDVASEFERLTAAREALKAYVAALLRDVLEERVVGLDRDIARLDQRIEALRRDDEENERTRLSLEREVSASGGARISQIDLELAQKTANRDERRRRADTYAQVGASLGLDTPASPEQFADVLTEVRRRLANTDDEESALQNLRISQELELKGLRDKHAEHETEITSLSKRRSNLPAPMIQLRERLCDELGLSAEALPFAGELIEVRKEASAWEGAAERLLHGFALTLLVPARHYEHVAVWVDDTHLASRLVYYRVSEGAPVVRQWRHPHAMPEKLRLKDDTPLYPWLQREVDQRFDHVCCATIEQFRREPKAITLRGQIKGKGDRHEKDDRRRLDDRTHYVLGWSNAPKIAALTAEKQALQRAIQALAVKVADTQAKVRALTERRGRLERLTAFESYADIDWTRLARDIQALEQERRALAEGSDVLKALRARQEQAEADQRSLRSRLDAAKADQVKLTERREQMCARNAEAEVEIEAVPEDRRSAAAPVLDQLRTQVLGEQKITVEGASSREGELRRVLQDRIDARAASLKTLAARIVSAMRDYCNTYPEETRETDSSVEAADEFRAMLRGLLDEGLPRFEARFKALLNENAIREVAGFQSKLREEERTIRDRIETINHSLRDIDYNDGTYIELEASTNLDSEIRDFQHDLRKCTENTLTGSDEDGYAEAKFLEVKRVIERFRGREGLSELDQRWTRKVTDVRNWFEFSASERWRADGVEREHYSDSSGKSGGQKEKLAYTVLAASLAYQFGLDRAAERSRAFHFVIIDEAFSRGSDEAAEFGLTLFKKMGLQLLIATPLQKIHVIEPHVAAVGFVHNQDGRLSLLRNMTIEQYREERDRRAAPAERASM